MEFIDDTWSDMLKLRCVCSTQITTAPNLERGPNRICIHILRYLNDTSNDAHPNIKGF
jgi:hypothetical protein